MTRWYWAKIVLGMLAIFVVGMVGANVMSAGKEKATRFVASDASITLPMFGMPFMLEGSNIGKLKRLKIERSAPESVRAIHLTAELDSDAVLQKLATCQISLDDFDTIDENSTFVCVEPVDSITRGMDRFGTIRLEPSGELHILLAPEEVRNKLAHIDGNEAAPDSVNGLTVNVDGAPVLRIRASSGQP